MTIATEQLWAIEPWQSVGPLREGMTRGEVHAVIGPPTQVFMKSKDDVSKTEAFDSYGLHAYFDERDRLDYLEVHNFGTVIASYRGIPLAGARTDLMSALRDGGVVLTLRPDGDYYVLDDSGVELYRYDPDGETFDSVMISLTRAAFGDSIVEYSPDNVR